VTEVDAGFEQLFEIGLEHCPVIPESGLVVRPLQRRERPVFAGTRHSSESV
jgi:hypothetical protein